MVKKYICWFLLLTTFTVTAISQIKIKYQETNATLYANKKLEFVFSVTGNVGPFSIKYNGIPNYWQTNGNNLVLSNITKQSVEDWTFDINITDRERNNLIQTVKLTIKNLRIQLSPVTLGQTQNSFVSRGTSIPQPFSTFNLTELISKYPGIQTNPFGETLVGSSVITPLIIANQQARYIPQRDARQISPLQQQRNALIIRQNNADKAIANLLTIIQRITGSTNEANTKLLTQYNKLSYMKQLAFNCSQDRFKIQNTIAKIKNAIDDRRTKINQEKIQIDVAEKTISQLKVNNSVLVNQKYDIQRVIKPEGFLVMEAQKRMTQCESNVKNTNTEIQATRDIIRNNTLQMGVANDSIEESNKRLKTINQSLILVRQTIADLRKQLADAQQQQRNLISNQSYYLYLPIQTRYKIEYLSRKNNQSQQKIKQLKSKNNLQQVKCDKIRSNITALKQKISLGRQNYTIILKNIDDIKNSIETYENQIKYRNTNSQNMSVEVTALSNQLSKYFLQLAQQKYICQMTEQKKVKQQVTIDDLNKIVQTNKNASKQFNMNLQKARIQKEVADRAMNDLINIIANVTYYSITPNGGSLILGGTPPGNNPSGAALGPAFRVDSIERGGIKIDNLTVFLSTVYGMNIDPTDLLQNLADSQKNNSNVLIASNITSTGAVLFSMDKTSQTSIIPQGRLSNLNNFQCRYSSTITTRSGLLYQVVQGSGSLHVIDSLGQDFYLSLSSCTKIASTKPTDFFKRGNKIFFTGAQVSSLLNNNIYDTYSILIFPRD